MNTPLLVILGILLVVLMAVTAGAADINEQASAQIARIEQDLRAAQELRDAAVREVASLKSAVVERDAQIAQLQDRYNALDAHVRELNAIIVGLQDDLAVAQVQQSPQIPVTGEGASPQMTGPLCLVTRAAVMQGSGSLLAVLTGVVALGGGGLAAYRAGDRKVTVRMTRSQLQDYIRYQREAGNRVK